jgi:hypothetical protein
MSSVEVWILIAGAVAILFVVLTGGIVDEHTNAEVPLFRYLRGRDVTPPLLGCQLTLVALLLAPIHVILVGGLLDERQPPLGRISIGLELTVIVGWTLYLRHLVRRSGAARPKQTPPGRHSRRKRPTP